MGLALFAVAASLCCLMFCRSCADSAIEMPCWYCLISCLCELYAWSRIERYAWRILWESPIVICGHPSGSACFVMLSASSSAWLLSVGFVPSLFGSIRMRISRTLTGLSCQVFGVLIVSPGCKSGLTIAIAALVHSVVVLFCVFPPSCGVRSGELFWVASVSIKLSAGLVGSSLYLLMKSCCCCCSKYGVVMGMSSGWML